MGFFSSDNSQKTDKRGISIQETNRSKIEDPFKETDLYNTDNILETPIESKMSTTNSQTEINGKKSILSDISEMFSVLLDLPSSRKQKQYTPRPVNKKSSSKALLFSVTVLFIAIAIVVVLFNVKKDSNSHIPQIDNAVESNIVTKDYFDSYGKDVGMNDVVIMYEHKDHYFIKEYINSNYYDVIDISYIEGVDKSFNPDETLSDENYLVKTLPLKNLYYTPSNSEEIYNEFSLRVKPLQTYYTNFYNCTTLCHGPTVFQKVNFNSDGTDNITLLVTPYKSTFDTRVSYRAKISNYENINTDVMCDEICSLFGDLNNKHQFKQDVNEFAERIKNPPTDTSSHLKIFTTLSGADVVVKYHSDKDKGINELIIQCEYICF